MEHLGFFRFIQKFYILEKKRTIHFWVQEFEFAFCQKKPFTDVHSCTLLWLLSLCFKQRILE